MAIISSEVQSSWRDSFASSSTVKLTLRANGEEQAQLITPHGSMVRAGFDAPTEAPTCAAGSSGSLTNGKFVAYRYVYASSRYPFVDNAVTGGGTLYPRSNPSDASAVFTVTATGAVTVTVTKSTRSDIDKIWIYRTAQADTADDAEALADAGQMYYVGSVGNNGLAGTATYSDTTATDTSELLELDNYPAPTFAFTVFDGVQWWGFGNPDFTADVTLDSTEVFTMTEPDEWFRGRDGQIATFDGMSSGGFDGRGSFYVKWTGTTSGKLYLDAELTQTLAIRATGTTRIHIRGQATTLYRSKPRNPFSWGWTENIRESGSVVRVPQLYALKVGGGTGTAIAVLADDRRLKVDTEAPASTYTFDLSRADDFTAFAESKQIVDSKFSVSSHFSQFSATLPEGGSVLMGLDVKNFAILQSDGDTQMPVSSPVFETLRELEQSGTDSHFFHGVYDPRTELNCFWVKQLDYGDDHKCDTLIWSHAPTGQWGVMRDFDISASGAVYDPETKESLVLVGSESGHILRAFSPDSYVMRYNRSTLRSGVIGNNSGIVPPYVALAGGTFIDDRTFSTITPSRLSVGQAITVNDNNGATVDATVLAINGNVVTVDSLGGVFYDPLSIMTLEIDGEWIYVTDFDLENGVWARVSGSFLNGSSNLELSFDYYIEDGSTDVGTGTPPLISSSVFGCFHFIGVTPVRMRRYFDLQSPTKAKKSSELWLTAQNVNSLAGNQSDSIGLSVSWFKEYSDTPFSRFKPNRDKISGSTTADSVNWLTKTKIPSILLNQFGVEITELGYEAFRLHTLHIKTANG